MVHELFKYPIVYLVEDTGTDALYQKETHKWTETDIIEQRHRSYHYDGGKLPPADVDQETTIVHLVYVFIHSWIVLNKYFLVMFFLTKFITNSTTGN